MPRTDSYWIAAIAFRDWHHLACQSAQHHDIELAEIDWLLQAVARVDRLALRLTLMSASPGLELACPFEQIKAIWEQRLRDRTPLQYLVGQVSWRQFELDVSPAVLIPRPETELLIDWAIKLTQTQPALRAGSWADLGTGSGAIALGLAAAFPEAEIHAIDRSLAALELARQNAQRNQLGDRIQFHQGNWFEPLHAGKHQLCGMVANPPYIPTAELQQLQPEVKDHEPRLALDGGLDGLASIRTLVIEAPQFLQPGGLWLIETMAGQAQAVQQLLSHTQKYSDIQTQVDLAGLERFAMAYAKDF